MDEDDTPKPASPLSREKQYELLYWDFVTTIADRKKTIFDLSRWIVTLQGLIVGFVAVQDLQFEGFFFIVPLLIGAVGCLLLSGLDQELSIHRRNIARLQMRVGEDFAELSGEHIAAWGNPDAASARGIKDRAKANYWSLIKASHWIVVIGSSLLAAVAVFLASGAMNPAFPLSTTP